jgi:hypothetical protein
MFLDEGRHDTVPNLLLTQYLIYHHCRKICDVFTATAEKYVMQTCFWPNSGVGSGEDCRACRAVEQGAPGGCTWPEMSL